VTGAKALGPDAAHALAGVRADLAEKSDGILEAIAERHGVFVQGRARQPV
jgi:hypothetical protein